MNLYFYSLEDLLFQEQDYLIEEIKETFPNLYLDDLLEKKGNSHAFLTLDEEENIVAWIDFEEENDRKIIHNIELVKGYEKEEILDNLIEYAIYELNTKNPTIYLTEEKKSYLNNLIEKYNWKETSTTIYEEEAIYGYNEPSRQKMKLN